jgi:hypothetical protein
MLRVRMFNTAFSQVTLKYKDFLKIYRNCLLGKPARKSCVTPVNSGESNDREQVRMVEQWAIGTYQLGMLCTVLKTFNCPTIVKYE